MADQGLNSLLKWSIENSEASRNDPTSQSSARATDPAGATTASTTSGLDPALLAQLMGGPSDADLMRESMAAIHSTTISQEEKMIAWDNFEQLIENLDNANNMTPLGLWLPLVEKFADEEDESRMMACWCASTAVQNNIKCQEQLLATPGAVPSLVRLAVGDRDKAVRRKACSAISSVVRNYQPACDVVVAHLPQEYKPASAKIDAGDMDAVDEILQKLRQHATAN